MLNLALFSVLTLCFHLKHFALDGPWLLAASAFLANNTVSSKRKKNLVWGPCKLNLWNITLFRPPFVLLLYLCNGYKLHPLKGRIKSILFCYFCHWFFSLPVILKIYREISSYDTEIPLCQHLQSTIQKTQKTARRCLQRACVSVGVCCAQVPSPLGVPLGRKTLCFPSVEWPLLALIFLICEGFCLQEQLRRCVITRLSLAHQEVEERKAYMFLRYKIMKNFKWNNKVLR